MRRLRQQLYEWVEIHGLSRGLPYPWNSHLIHLKEANVRALVDPLPMSDEDLAEVEGIGAPTHILITNNYHERSADEYRARWNCKTLLHENQLGEAQCEVDGALKSGQILWDSIEVIRAPDVRFAEEVSFLLKGDQTLIIGDLVSGPRQDVGIPDGAIGIRAPELYVDLVKARETLRSLLAMPFDRLCFAHGSPLDSGAKAVLTQFVNDDRTWLELEVARLAKMDR